VQEFNPARGKAREEVQKVWLFSLNTQNMKARVENDVKLSVWRVVISDWL
jgi:hypothetical protein